MQTTFRDLRIGQTFDFIGPDRQWNSFYEKCRKVTSRGYVSIENPGRYGTMRVGSIDAEVFHVDE